MRAHLCVACGRVVQAGKGERLFYRPDGSEVWLHDAARCQDVYAGPDLPEAAPSPAGQLVLEAVAHG